MHPEDNISLSIFTPAEHIEKSASFFRVQPSPDRTILFYELTKASFKHHRYFSFGFNIVFNKLIFFLIFLQATGPWELEAFIGLSWVRCE